MDELFQTPAFEKLQINASQWFSWKKSVHVYLERWSLHEYASSTKPINWNEKDDKDAYTMVYISLGVELRIQCSPINTCHELWSYLESNFEPKDFRQRYNIFRSFLRINRKDYNCLVDAISALERSIAECRNIQWEIADELKVIQLLEIAKDDFPAWVKLKLDFIERVDDDDSNPTFKQLLLEALDRVRARPLTVKREER